ncbi:MAG TPA: hypothetical protein VF530_20615 [Planctomycetota bacterium]
MTAGAARPGDPRWLRLRALFTELVELPESARAEALARVGPEDPALAAELAALLAAVSADLEPGAPRREQVGAWRLEGLLARDSSSSVHLARHRARSTPAMLRLVPVEGPEPIERLRELLPRLTQLRHPALVRWLECGLCTAPGSGVAALYLVAPRLEGDAAAEQGHGAELLVEACEALAEAHAAGLAHGRLGPETVRVDADGRLRILDLGLEELLAGARRPSAADDVHALAAALLRVAGDAAGVPEPVRRAAAGATGEQAADLARAWRAGGRPGLR